MEYTSERLLLREYKEEEFPLFYSLFSNEEVMRYAWADYYKKEDEARPYFNKILTNNRKGEDRKIYEYGVYLLSNGSFIGSADIEIHYRNSFGGCGEIGYFLLPAHWGKGYATEISKRLLKVAFIEIGLHRVSARCNANNHKSENIMKKIGMVKEGRLRQARYKYGSWDDELLYGVTKDDWELEK